MKKNALKILALLLLIINSSCNNDDDNCANSIYPLDFNVKVKLVSPTGENLFNDTDFDISLLELKDPNSSDLEIPFSQLTENGEELISFNATSIESVNFIYDNEIESYFGFHDIETQTINCFIVVTDYEARKLNGDLICDCSAQDVLVISIDL